MRGLQLAWILESWFEILFSLPLDIDLWSIDQKMCLSPKYTLFVSSQEMCDLHFA